jgi:hypothetical protein
MPALATKSDHSRIFLDIQSLGQRGLLCELDGTQIFDVFPRRATPIVRTPSASRAIN